MNNDKYRTFDGSDNNLANPDWGRANTQLLRKTEVAYEDGKSSLAIRGGRDINPRDISNAVCTETAPVDNTNSLTDFVWAWGQFLDHEMDLSPEAENPKEPHPIQIPKNDPEKGFGGGTIPFSP